MIELILTIVLFWGLFFIINTIIWYIYDKKAFTPKPWSMFDAYPFLCRTCMNMWLLITSYVMAGMLINDVWFMGLGILLSILYGYGLHKRDNERFKE